MNRKNFSRIVVCALMAASLFVGAEPSHAYCMAGAPCGVCMTPFLHWADSSLPIKWYHNQLLQGAGKGPALGAALNTWTAVVGANHTLLYSTSTDGFVTDGKNTFVWGASGGCTGSCLAITAVVLSGLVIKEADILFNNAQNWTTFDTQAVATHELGHSLGIAHTNVVGPPQPTMTAAYFGVGGRTLEADDIMALQCAEAMY